jgi:hypothetical protein
VHPDRQWSLGRDRRVELAKRSGGGVARVRGGSLPLFGEALVQLSEARERHVDLTSDLQERRRRLALREHHARRDRPDRPEVRGDILASVAIASRGAADELAVFVDQVDRGAVDLRLRDKGDRLVAAKALADVVDPLLEGLLGRDLLERPHRREMLHLLEALGGGRSDATGGRVRSG